MNDYISRAAAIKTAIEWYDTHFRDGESVAGLATGLKNLPSADVVEVVRCKDCKHYYFADNRIPQEQRYVCDLDGDRWKPDNFCSYGERREDWYCADAERRGEQE